jgi:ribosomal protein S20
MKKGVDFYFVIPESKINSHRKMRNYSYRHSLRTQLEETLHINSKSIQILEQLQKPWYIEIFKKHKLGVLHKATVDQQG